MSESIIELFKPILVHRPSGTYSQPHEFDEAVKSIKQRWADFVSQQDHLDAVHKVMKRQAQMIAGLQHEVARLTELAELAKQEVSDDCAS